MIIQEEDLDGFGATVNSRAVLGLYTIMEAIVMVDSNDTIWAAIIDQRPTMNTLVLLKVEEN